MASEKSAVVVRNAYKKYGNGPNILKNFNMNIPKNQIYGLLGSSGCGKTTLLKSLVGAQDLDYGSIDLIVTSKKKIGFMPQETALFDEFTIAETFQFFARLYRISDEQFKSKMKEMQDVLDLPPHHRTCDTLSGGQVRRVSIAVTLLHSPALVILDEPTSGLDPMLAHYFWKYLQRMALGGQTIIITTHYIEEARQANIVGLMRQGVLLAEEPPEQLIATHGVDNLEDVFLRLCHQQNHTVEQDLKEKIPFVDPYRYDVKSSSMFWPHTQALIYKNIKWVQRNFMMFSFLSFILSVACVIESNECLKFAPPMRIGIVNHGANNCSTFSSSGYNCSSSIGKDQLDFSCDFIETWRDQIPDAPMIIYDNKEEAMRKAKSRYLVAFLEIPKNFTDGVLQRFEQGWSVDKDLVDSSIMDIHQDSTDFMTTYKLEQSIRNILSLTFQQHLSNCGYLPKVAQLPPMKINLDEFFGEGVHHNPNDYTVHVAMSCMVGVTFLLPCILLTLSLCLEKMTGAYTRCIIGGVRISEILAGYTVVLVLFNLLNIGMMSFVQFVFYGKPYGNFWLSYLMLNAIGFAGIFFGFFVVVFTRNLIESAGVCIIASVSSYTFTGFIWPIEAAMFPQVRYISNAILPNTLVLKSIFAIIWKNASILNKQVYLGFFICAIHTLVYILFIYLKVSNRKTL